MGVQISKNNGKYLYTADPRKDLMKALVNKTRTVGHILSFTDANQDPEMINPNNYAFYFGSFSEAAKLAWKEVSNPQQRTSTSGSGVVQIPASLSKLKEKAQNSKPNKWHKHLEDDVQPVIEAPLEVPSDIANNSPQDSSTKKPTKSENKRVSNWGRNPSYTNEQIKGMIIAFYRRNGRLPAQVDTLSEPGLPSWPTLRKHLGPKSEWEKLIPASLAKAESASGSDVTLQKSTQISKDSLDAKRPQATTNEAIIATDKNAITTTNKTIAASDDAVATGEATITTNQYWDGETLLVELTVLKPGSEKPLKITLAV